MKMKVLFDINHPAQAHLFRNFIIHLKNRGDADVMVTIREKDITKIILDHFKIDSLVISRPRLGVIGMIAEFLEKDINLFLLNLKNRFHFSFGTSFATAHLSILFKHQSYNFNEDDDAIVPLHAKITYPFTTKIIVPSCLEYSKWTNKRVVHNSFHELAYLHPNNFTPNQEILNKYQLKPGKYIVARFSSLQAHHDVGVQGISNALWSKIEKEIEGYPVIRSIEKNNTHQINPWDMHHILAYAGMVICDSQTMTAEAAVLGVPSVRINSFARRIGYLKELEFKYELTKSFLPNEEKDILAYIKSLVLGNFDLTTFQNRRAHMLSEKVDFNQWMIDFFNQELKSV